ncbi:MAG: XdhC family protein [Cyclobacteriaceae bacterium]|nr:XdhC family protein [Cyclobacteriaceae bacterium]
MKEIKTIVENLKKATKDGVRTALASVVHVYGSSYRRTGARMLIREDGYWYGSVSGGCLEGDVITKAMHTMKSNQAELFTYDTRQNAKNAFGMGYGCNGLLEILIEPIAYAKESPAFAMFDELLRGTGTQGLTTIYFSENEKTARIGQRQKYDGNSTISHRELSAMVAKDLSACIRNNEAAASTYRIDGAKIKVFHEVFPPNIDILIYGAVFHVVPFMHIAKVLGYNVHVTDSFEPIQPIWNFPNAEEIALIEDSEVNKLISSTPQLAVVFLTHNFFYIKEQLPKVLKSAVPYIGILGSRKKTQKILREAEINETNYSEQQLQKIHYPIGLDIGADTPEEIALSILAEIRAFYAGKGGVPLKTLSGSIHTPKIA